MSSRNRFGEALRFILPLVAGLLMLTAGAPLAYGGWQLLALGGSAYYLPAGLVLMIAGVLTLFRRIAGVALYLCLYAFTLAWAIWEVGFDFWKLSPRIIAPTVVAILALLCAALAMGGKAGRGNRRRNRIFGLAGAGALTLCLMIFAGAALRPHGAIYASRSDAGAKINPAAPGGDWLAYGRTNEGRRFAPFSQINRQNVKDLEIAWTAHTGDVPGIGAADENTPLQIGAKLISCSPHNIVHALDVDTGQVLWAFDPKADAIRPRCRSVGYYRDDAVSADDPREVDGKRPCRERLVIATIGAQLIELDLETGKPCDGFGVNGSVDLNAGLGKVEKSHYFVTSAPTVTNGLIIVGGTVIDSADVDVPSGVVRAFDARTGELRWFWDLGRTGEHNSALPPGAVYTRGTPMYLLGKVGSPEQKSRFLEKLVSGENRSAFFMTEPAAEGGAGSDPSMMMTTCRPDGNHWLINGRKAFITGAVGAQVGIVMAKSEDGACMFLVDLPDPAIKVDRILDTIDSSLPGGHAVITIDNLRVPADQMLGKSGEGFKYAQVRLSPARLSHWDCQSNVAMMGERC